ncbi:TolC family outer membrane protein [Legionella waltersii]|uniref:Outer membrane protein TolC n=1 Tax=Legionella waltersii TaxID=66969 RepID=A0A0W1AP45_9GAMM|nr:TolC family outer membrane protein [Legionella waltersii]KTD83103.1 outer membrane protein TolC [Legionella waltersii]SNU96683.1 outer membrane protein TolC [Legionella waltersii]
MAKECLKFIRYLIFLIISAHSYASDLLAVFQKAVESDPTYLEVVEETLANEENIAINRSVLLPNVSAQVFGRKDFFRSKGASTDNDILPPKSIFTTFQPQLSVSQTIFNFAHLAKLHGAQLSAKQANAKLNVAFQNLLIRVAQAYFNVLQDEDNLRYHRASKQSFAKQLYQARQLQQAGKATLTDVYTAESAYGTAKSGYINAKTKLAIDKDFLTTITGEYINNLAKLKLNFPLISPKPQKINEWVNTAKQQNWDIKANLYGLQAARELIKQNVSENLPDLKLRLSSLYNTSNSTGSSFLAAPGTSKKTDNVVAINLNIPIVSGGLTVAKTRQAQFKYKAAYQNLENSYRNTVFSTRKNYLNIVADIGKLKNDIITLKSAKSSLHGLKTRYNAGSGNIVDVLIQQEKVLKAQSENAANKYSYIMNYLSLKQSIGTLSITDLHIVNSWLITEKISKKLIDK